MSWKLQSSTVEVVAVADKGGHRYIHDAKIDSDLWSVVQ